MATLSIKNLAKHYGETRVLSGIELAVEDGEFVVLVGPSGCGKSTLLRMIAGLDAPTLGDISIGDRMVNGLAPAERKIAMVFQSYALYPHMNVRKNMTFGLKFTGVERQEMDRRVAEAARMLQLEPLLERQPRDLSGGQRQRVAIGRAIVREPDVFLFDEPLSNLDAALRVSTRVEIARLHRLLRATMIYVTHDQIEAMTLADRIVVMNQGRIEQVGKPLDLYYTPANLFVAGFIGSPAMNFFKSKVERIADGRAHIAGPAVETFVAPASAALGQGASVTIGVRPEHLDIGAPGAFAAKGTVELVERLGESSFAYIRRADEQMMVAEVRGRQTPSAGDTLSLGADLADVHLFDEAGRRIEVATA
ncbi:MAG TPA: sn-glycerol-3-phosphate ABC transporter ATP-binding protein UgpC [Roseiarcus sp.]